MEEMQEQKINSEIKSKTDNNNKFQFEAIGIFRSEVAFKSYEAPRQGQGTGDDDVGGEITLFSGHNFTNALDDINGFERIWLIYVFHHNMHNHRCFDGKKTKVLPPRCYDGKKKGIFATRSPHRPNPIGLSCVRLIDIRGLHLFVQGCDLLDQTPILDIKPYIPCADSFVNSRVGWLENMEDYACKIEIADNVLSCFKWIEEHAQYRFIPFLHKHLSYQPTNTTHKRVRPSGINNDLWLISIQSWRIFFRVITDEETSIPCKVIVEEFYSGYCPDELKVKEDNGHSELDPCHDKDLHRAFIEKFPSHQLPSQLYHHRHYTTPASII